MRLVSADWVVPVEGDPISDGAVAIGDDGRIAAVGPAAELGAGERFDDAVILPGLRQRPLAPRVRRLRRLRRRAAVRALDRPARAPQEPARARGDGGDRPRRRRGLPPLGDHDGRRRELLRRGGDRVRRARAARGRLPRGVRRAARRSRERFEPMRERLDGTLLRRGAARHLAARAVHVHARALRGVPGARAAGHDAPLRERARGRVRARRQRAVVGARRPAGGAARDERHPRARRSGACSTRGVVAAHCVTVDEEEIALLAAHDVAVAHCPRSNGYLGCGVAPLLELRARRGARLRSRTDSPASTPGFDMFEELRAALTGARARERDAGALLAARRARARHSGRRARARARRRGRLARARQTGRPGRRLTRRLAARPGRGPSRGCGSRRLTRPRPRYSRRRRGALPERNHHMARYQKSGPKRPKPNAPVSAARCRRQPTPPAIEDTMFFPRLRRHAKWMFVFLALVFGLGFVGFGVGAGGVGFGDVFRGGGGGGPVGRRRPGEDRGEPEGRRRRGRSSRRRCRPKGDTVGAIEAQRSWSRCGRRTPTRCARWPASRSR